MMALEQSPVRGAEARSESFPAATRWLRLVRVRNVVRSATLGALAAHSTGAGSRSLTIFLLSLSVSSAVIFANVTNDIADQTADRYAGKLDRPLAMGEIEEGSARIAAYVAALFAVGAGLAVSPFAGVFAASMLLLATGYNAILKATSFIGNAIVAIQTALIVPYAIIYSNAPRDSRVVLATAFIAAATFIYEISKTLLDTDADLAAGVVTAGGRHRPDALRRKVNAIWTCGLLLLLGTGISAFAQIRNMVGLLDIPAMLFLFVAYGWLGSLVRSSGPTERPIAERATRSRLKRASWVGMLGCSLLLAVS